MLDPLYYKQSLFNIDDVIDIGKNYEKYIQLDSDDRTLKELTGTRSTSKEAKDRFSEEKEIRTQILQNYKFFKANIEARGNEKITCESLRFINYIDSTLKIFPQNVHEKIIDVLCKIASLLRLYGLVIDTSVYMNVLKYIGEGLPIDKIMSNVICNHALLDFRNNKIVKIPRSYIREIKEKNNTISLDYEKNVCVPSLPNPKKE